MQGNRWATAVLVIAATLLAGCGEMSGDSTPDIPSQERESERLLERVEIRRDSYEEAVERYGENSDEAASALRTARHIAAGAVETCEVLFDCPAYQDIHDVGTELGIDFTKVPPK